MAGQSVKSGVLQALEENRGCCLSGEDLAQKLNCSRAAVWKAVTRLREEGYHISSGTNRGYVLESDNDILSPEAVQQRLHDPSIPVFTFKELSSTNEKLKEKLLEKEYGYPSGTMVISEVQTRGKGRSGRSFSSPQGTGLYMSIFLKPQKTFIPQSLGVRAAAAVAVYRGVKEVLGTELEIQWVNDLYFHGKKVGGILTEALTNLETGDMEQAIVGIGLRLFDTGTGGIFPEKSCQIDRNALAASILNAFLEEAYRETVSELYRSRNLAIGRPLLLTQGGRTRRILGLDILPDGQLKAVAEDGKEEYYIFGEVRMDPEYREHP